MWAERPKKKDVCIMKEIIPLIVSAVMAITGCASQTNKMAGGNETIMQTDKTGAVLTFSSFDGGGPDYSAVLESDIVSYEKKSVYGRADHEIIEGAACDVVFTFKGKKAGETQMTIEERSPIAGNFDHTYKVKVDESLNVSIEKLKTIDLDAFEPMPMLVIKANGKVFYANFADNPSAREFAEKLSGERLTLDMSDYGNFEKVGELPWTLPENNESVTTKPGDIVLYDGDKITIYYDENTWGLTRLAKIEYVTKEELLEALGSGDVSVSFETEWSE